MIIFLARGTVWIIVFFIFHLFDNFCQLNLVLARDRPDCCLPLRKQRALVQKEVDWLGEDHQVWSSLEYLFLLLCSVGLIKCWCWEFGGLSRQLQLTFFYNSLTYLLDNVLTFGCKEKSHFGHHLKCSGFKNSMTSSFPTPRPITSTPMFLEKQDSNIRSKRIKPVLSREDSQ